VFFFSLWISFSWAVLYMTFTAVPLVFRVSHGFDVQQTGAVFACELLSIFIWLSGTIDDRIYLPSPFNDCFQTYVDNC
jgi:hypothetical protein